MASVDADQRRPGPQIGFHELPGVAILARGTVALRKPHHCPWHGEAQHGACVGAGRGDDEAVVEAHVGQKALVALNEGAAHKRGGQAHAAEPRCNVGPSASLCIKPLEVSIASIYLGELPAARMSFNSLTGPLSPQA